MKKSQSPPGETVIFRRFRRAGKGGKLLDAWEYGYKAWPIRVRTKPKGRH